MRGDLRLLTPTFYFIWSVKGLARAYSPLCVWWPVPGAAPQARGSSGRWPERRPRLAEVGLLARKVGDGVSWVSRGGQVRRVGVPLDLGGMGRRELE